MDDVPAVRTRFALLLGEVSGVARTFEASDDVQALDVFVAEAPEVVVLDLHLAGILAFDLLIALKASLTPPLVVMITSDPSEHHRLSCMARGADHFFDKAREFDRVVDVVVEELARRSHESVFVR